MSAKHYLYRHFAEDGLLLYVGISLSAVQRLCQHREMSDWFGSIRTITIEPFDSKKEAQYAERIAVQTEAPVFNVQYNDPLTGTNPALDVKKSEGIEIEVAQLVFVKTIQQIYAGNTFTSNDLLEHPTIREAAKEAVESDPSPRKVGRLLRILYGKRTPYGRVTRAKKPSRYGMIWRIIND